MKNIKEIRKENYEPGEEGGPELGIAAVLLLRTNKFRPTIPLLEQLTDDVSDHVVEIGILGDGDHLFDDGFNEDGVSGILIALEVEGESADAIFAAYIEAIDRLLSEPLRIYEIVRDLVTTIDNIEGSLVN